MTNAIDAGVPWIASGAVVVFLIVCVWHNRRSGYQRIRAEKIPLGEAMARIRQSLSLREDALPVANQPSTASNMSTQTEQLLSLSSALKRPVPVQPNEVGEAVPAEALGADALVEEPAVRK